VRWDSKELQDQEVHKDQKDHKELKVHKEEIQGVKVM